MNQITRTEDRERVSPSALSLPPAIWKSMGGSVMLILLSGDFLLLVGAALVSRFVTGAGWLPQSPESRSFLYRLELVGIFILFCMTSFALLGAYDPSIRRSPKREIVQVIGVASLATLGSGILVSLLSLADYTLAQSVLLWSASASLLVLGRLALGNVTQRAHPVIIVGTPDAAISTYAGLKRRDGRHRVVGLVGLPSANGHVAHSAVDTAAQQAEPPLHDPSALSRLLAEFGPCEVVVSVPTEHLAMAQDVVQAQVAGSPQSRVTFSPPAPDDYADTDGSRPAQDTATRIYATQFPWQYEGGKRVFDILVSCAFLLAAAPVMALIAAAIKLDSRGPVLYKQARIGRHGQPFFMYKFRSMREGADSMIETLRQQNEASGPIFKMRRDPRVTRVGAIIRRLSLDELPQLFNILQGTMSLVGPRPPLPDEVRVYESWHHRRLEPVPGLTGLWQVNRSPDPSFDEMFHLDLAYIEHWSLALDLAIILKTIPTVITARGAY